MKRHDRVGCIPDLYLYDPRFKSEAGEWLSRHDSVILFSTSRPMKNIRIYLKCIHWSVFYYAALSARENYLQKIKSDKLHYYINTDKYIRSLHDMIPV
jgi:hypothetical protein